MPGTRVEVLALALDPQVARNGLVYVVRAVLDGAAPVFQLVRYSEVGGALGEAATLLDNVPLDSLRSPEGPRPRSVSDRTDGCTPRSKNEATRPRRRAPTTERSCG